MRILSLTAGAAQMYCGSCLRDNALARELIRQGHEVHLVPIYTPTKTDEPNASSGRVLFGGISVYLQQHSSFFRHTPQFLDRLWDSRWALRAASKGSLGVDPRELGALTVSMLEGEGGPLDKEFRKLEDWLSHQPRPDIINLPNAMLIAMAPAIRRVYDGPVVCTLQGEDLFLQGLPEPYRSQSLGLIAKHAPAVEGFISISDFYAGHMAEFLRIPPSKIHIVSLGLDTTDFQSYRKTPNSDDVFRLGYLARVAPEKGLRFLIETWKEFRRRVKGPARLEAAGYLAPEHNEYLDSVRSDIEAAGLGAEFHYRGELSRTEKIDFLHSLDCFCVPATFDEPKGLYVLEAMAAGVPVLAPDRGVFPEHLDRCDGGLLFDPSSPAALAAHLETLYRDPAFRRALGQRGREGVLLHATLSAMARRTVEVYAALSPRSRTAVAHSAFGGS